MPFCYSAPHAYNLQNFFFFFSVLCAIFLVSPANRAATFNVFEFMMYAVEDKYKLQVVYYIGLLYVYLSFPCGMPSVLSLVSFTARYQGLVPSPVAAWADYLAPVPDTMCQQAPRKRCHELRFTCGCYKSQHIQWWRERLAAYCFRAWLHATCKTVAEFMRELKGPLAHDCCCCYCYS